MVAQTDLVISASVDCVYSCFVFARALYLKESQLNLSSDESLRITLVPPLKTSISRFHSTSALHARLYAENKQRNKRHYEIDTPQSKNVEIFFEGIYFLAKLEALLQASRLSVRLGPAFKFVG